MAFERFFRQGRPRLPAILLIPLLALTACEDEEAPVSEVVRPVIALKVSDVLQIRGRRFAGRAKAAREVVLSFRVGGQLAEFDVNVGDTFAAGEVMVQE